MSNRLVSTHLALASEGSRSWPGLPVLQDLQLGSDQPCLVLYSAPSLSSSKGAEWVGRLEVTPRLKRHRERPLGLVHSG